MKAIDWKGQNIAWKKLRKVSINGNLSHDHVLEELILLRRKNWIPKFQLPFLAWKLTVQFNQLLSLVRLFATPWTAAHQGSLSITNSQSLLKLMPIESVMPSNHLTLCHPSLLPPSIFPSIRLFSNESVFSHQVAKVLEFHLQHQSLQWIFRTDFFEHWLLWSPCSARDSQESSPTPQFKSINSSALSFLYRSTLTSIHDYWKNHSFD